ncbi:MAG: hypothetical protein HOK72_10535 [Flavobacteriales bacterium]|jgi:hypothetical protein|nr:hypothetical protein [Flavobacteriales bacterium]
MKKILLSLVAIATISLSALGQAPEGFKYQAVVRDAGNLILNNQAVGMRLTIQQGSIGGVTVYSETFSITTNTYGLVNLEIGTGTTAYDFSTIDWGNGPYFMETAVDVTGGTSYAVMGTSQLMSVPYALHSKTAENVTNDLVDDADADPTNELQDWSNLPGIPAELADGTDDVDDADADPTNEIQIISISNDTIYLTSGGFALIPQAGFVDWNNIINIPADFQDGDDVDDADNDPANELQDWSTLPGIPAELTDGDDVDDADADPLNEMQSLTISGQDLSISNGNTITLPASGVTLDEAYDFGGAGAGRLIIADAGEVEIQSNSANGIALRTTNSSTGVGVLASSTNASNPFSTIQSTTNSASNVASAVIGNTDGTAWGVSGQASATSSATAAVYGSNLRTVGGHGVLGIGVNGVVGQTNYQTGFGLYGQNFDLTGPLGNAVGTYGIGYIGVWGDNNGAGGYSIYANGDLGASGIKTFSIDHPKDPENKYLRHFSIEANEVLNVYRGNAEFDTNGDAVVVLPDYFDMVNNDNVSYQLTPVGGYAPLYIKEKVVNGQFLVGGGTAGMEVSWIIHVERDDPYMQQHPEKRNVEVEKEDWNKGKYLQPVLYNESDDKRIVKPLEKSVQKELNLNN